ncbi:hypothetical protein ACFE04_002693 [Oxalis oulophora]
MTFTQFMRKMQRCLFVLLASTAEIIPVDVKKGHFAVTAIEGGKKKRFIVELQYLTNPAFMKLLEQAREEYGFRQKGVLLFPCLPVELQNILAEKYESPCLKERQPRMRKNYSRPQLSPVQTP